DDVAAAINANEDAAALVSALTSGDTTNVAGTLAATNLAAGGGALSLESLEYGRDEFVNINVLSGTFGTYNADGTEGRRDVGSDIGVTINGFEAIGRGLRATLRASHVDAALTFTEDANVAATAVSVTINGGGAVFQIGQEVSAAGQVGIGIDAVNTARLGGTSGKLYELGSGGGKSLIDISRGDAQGVDA